MDKLVIARELIGKNDIQKAIKTMLKLTSEHEVLKPFENEIRTRQRSFNDAEKEIRIGTLGHEESHRTKNEIGSALLSILTKMAEELDSAKESEKQDEVKREESKVVTVINPKNQYSIESFFREYWKAILGGIILLSILSVAFALLSNDPNNPLEPVKPTTTDKDTTILDPSNETDIGGQGLPDPEPTPTEPVPTQPKKPCEGLTKNDPERIWLQFRNSCFEIDPKRTVDQLKSFIIFEAKSKHSIDLKGSCSVIFQGTSLSNGNQTINDAGIKEHDKISIECSGTTAIFRQNSGLIKFFGAKFIDPMVFVDSQFAPVLSKSDSTLVVTAPIGFDENRQYKIVLDDKGIHKSYTRKIIKSDTLKIDVSWNTLQIQGIQSPQTLQSNGN